MTNSVTENEHEQERSVRQAIEARLNPGERLVAYTTGKIYAQQYGPASNRKVRGRWNW